MAGLNTSGLDQGQLMYPGRANVWPMWALLWFDMLVLNVNFSFFKFYLLHTVHIHTVQHMTLEERFMLVVHLKKMQQTRQLAK